MTLTLVVILFQNVSEHEEMDSLKVMSNVTMETILIMMDEIINVLSRLDIHVQEEHRVHLIHVLRHNSCQQLHFLSQVKMT